MSNYSTDPAQCRVDFFKESGKWYDTCQFTWLHWGRDKLIHDVFRESLAAAFPNSYRGMRAICLEPYHEYAHPISFIHQP